MVFVSVGLTVTQNLKVWDSRTKNNWAFLMGYLTVGFKATLSASNSAQKCVWTRKIKSSAVDAIFVCCLFDEDVCCFRNLKSSLIWWNKASTHQNHSEAISTTRASRNLGKSVRWISIRLWSMKSQLIRASLLDSHIENARPKGFLFVSLPRGGMPAKIDRPELNLFFKNYYVMSTLAKYYSPVLAPWCRD